MISPTGPAADLAIVVVSTNEARWLEPCLTTVFASAGDIDLDVVVVNNQSTDGTREVVDGFPGARVVDSVNRGFGHANNRGALTANARYVLFLNPDTEVVSGTFEELVSLMDDRPHVGMAGVKQITADGELWPTVRYAPTPLRAWAEALAVHRWPVAPPRASELERDLDVYEREVTCDWTSGSFMLCRREALLSAGLMDERLFIYSEEPDLGRRFQQAGWEIRHLPQMTIVHHAGKAGVQPRMLAQDVFSRRQYADKHFGGIRRSGYLGGLLLRHAVRAVDPRGDAEAGQRRQAARLAVRTVMGRVEPPFGAPPGTALAPGAAAASARDREPVSG